jgi:tetratricopeptide (TPR) repeat protein
MEQQAQVLIEHYQKALIIKPGSASIYQDIGNLYRSQYEMEQALVYYLQAIAIKPNLFRVYYPLTFLLQFTSWSSQERKNQILEQGIAILNRNISQQPNFYFAHVVLGEIYHQQGNLAQAKQCYQTASFKQIQQSHPDLIDHWDTQQRRKPDFLGIGLPKCGTTSLYAYLKQHPQFLPAVTKEIRYFMKTNYDDLDLDYYLAHFPAIFNSDYLTGEVTPGYFTAPGAAQQIKTWFPNIKLILLLRNPIARTISGYYHGNQFAWQYLRKSLCGVNALNLDQVKDIVAEMRENRKLPFEEQVKIRKKWIQQILEGSISLDEEIAIHIASSLYINHLPEWFKHFLENKS